MIGAQLRQDVACLLAPTASLTERIVGLVLHARSASLDDALNSTIKSSFSAVSLRLKDLPSTAGVDPAVPPPVLAISQTEVDAFVAQVIAEAQKVVDSSLLSQLPSPFNTIAIQLNDSVIEPFLAHYLATKLQVTGFQNLLNTVSGVTGTPS